MFCFSPLLHAKIVKRDYVNDKAFPSLSLEDLMPALSRAPSISRMKTPSTSSDKLAATNTASVAHSFFSQSTVDD